MYRKAVSFADGAHYQQPNRLLYIRRAFIVSERRN